MDRDSEVETVLADEDWYGASGEGVSAAGRGTRRRNRREGRESRLLGPNNSDGSNAFDEEELFSASGSLSSLHEFSGSEDAQSDNSEGPIIRNGVSNLARNHLDDIRVDDGSPAGHAESEVDVDGEDARGVAHVKARHKPSTLRETNLSSSTPTWQGHRGRKVIADEDDEDESGQMSAVAADDADIEDGPDSTVRRKKQRLDHGARRLTGLSERQSPQEDAGLVDSLLRKHKPSKRRKPRYDEPDCLDDDGCPQLVYFASKGDTATCRKLLLRGATISKADAQGRTALHEASKHSYVETLELLLNPPARARIHADVEPG
ncbi:hypothetical protein GGI21_005913, partial [Coemansia aciculifera]